MLLHCNSCAQIVFGAFFLVSAHFTALILDQNLFEFFVCVENVAILLQRCNLVTVLVQIIVIEHILVVSCTVLLRLNAMICVKIVLLVHHTSYVLLHFLLLLSWLNWQKDVSCKLSEVIHLPSTKFFNTDV